MKLNYSSLGSLPTSVSVPSYDIKALQPGIFHIGVGNFHRAHQAMYLDRLFNLGIDHDWGLVGSGIKPGDRRMRLKLQAQDWLTTVVELDEKGLTARVCGSMIDFVETEPYKLVESLILPEIRIVSLTITEGGYFVNEKTGGFDLEHPDIQHDISNPDMPRTVFGILAAALDIRKKTGLAPFTVMSCDNAPDNGHLTHRALVGLANAIAPELGAWIDKEVAFPSSMVDCITPAISDQERTKLRNLFGVDDAAPVFCEPFRQWVLEDNFPQGRPSFEKVGVEFVDDVAPYELMKLRILNGGHAALSFPAALIGFHYVHEAMGDTAVTAYLKKFVTQEVIPTLQPVPGVDFNDYFQLIVERFSNAEVGDTVPRLCVDSSNRLPKFILPIIVANLDLNKNCPGLTLVIAFWCFYCICAAKNVDSRITLVDEQAERLKRYALRSENDPAAFLEMEDIFGQLGNHSVFVAQFTKSLEVVLNCGVRKTLENYNRRQ